MEKRKYYKFDKTNKRLLILILFSFFSQMLFSDINKLIEIKPIEKNYPLNSKLTIEIKINKNHKDYKFFQNHTKLIIQNKALKLINSKITIVYTGTLIKNTYLLKELGNFTLQPKLISKQKKLKLSQLSINIIPAPLTKKTKIRWLILSPNDVNKAEQTIYEGNQYILLLVGEFNKDSSNKIIDISCPTPEDSLLESIDSSLNLLQNSVIDKNLNIISSYLWTPLKSGNVFLPAPKIIIQKKFNKTDKLNVQTTKIFVNKSQLIKSKENTEKDIAIKTLKLAQLKIKKHKNVIDKNFDRFNEKIKIANKVFKLKKLQSSLFLNSNTKYEILTLEKKLNINKSFSLPNKFILKLTGMIIFIFILFIALIIILKTKKSLKSKAFIVILLFLPIMIYGILYFIFFTNKKNKIAMYIPNNKHSSIYIYQIPEIESTTLDSLKIGETVKIKKEISHWYLIQKKNGITGWQKKINFKMYN